MKSIIKNKEVTTEYPCLKENTIDGKKEVVLFYAKDCGVVVHSTKYNHPKGFHSDVWIEDLFTLCPDTIELSNN